MDKIYEENKRKKVKEKQNKKVEGRQSENQSQKVKEYP